MKNNYNGIQEKYISTVSVLNKENLYKLLVILRDMYPAGYTYKGLKERTGIKIMPESQLKELIDEGLLRLYDLPKFYKQNIQEYGKMFPQYMITKEGMMLLNSIEVYKLNKKIELLTQILVVFGIVTIILMIIQTFH